MKPLAVIIALSITYTSTLSQGLITELGYASIASHGGFDAQLTVNRSVSDRFGVLTNVTAAFANESSETNNRYQIGMTSGVYFRLFQSGKHTLLTELAIGSSYYSLKNQTSISFYGSLDYLVSLSKRSSIGLTAGVNGGDHAMQFINLGYLWSMYSKKESSAEGTNRFQVMAESTNEIGKNFFSPGISVVGALALSDIFSAGIGTGILYHKTRSTAPVFADFRLYLFQGKVSPYTVFRIGYNFSKVNYRGGFGDIGLGACVNLNPKSGVYFDGKLRKSSSTEEIQDQHFLISIGYKRALN